MNTSDLKYHRSVVHTCLSSITRGTRDLFSGRLVQNVIYLPIYWLGRWEMTKFFGRGLWENLDEILLLEMLHGSQGMWIGHVLLTWHLTNKNAIVDTVATSNFVSYLYSVCGSTCKLMAYESLAEPLMIMIL